MEVGSDRGRRIDVKKPDAGDFGPPERSLGSVIKLLAPNPDYTDEFNAWLKSIPSHIMRLVFIIKRFYKPEWGNDWARSHFSCRYCERGVGK